MESIDIEEPQDEGSQIYVGGHCKLIIIGENLDKDAIEKRLNLKATDFVTKGQVLSKILRPAPRDVWSYKVKFCDEMNFEASVLELLSKIEPSAGYLNEISKENEVYIRCFIQSDYAQISFELSAETLKRLSIVGLKFYFSIFSWGGVDDE